MTNSSNASYRRRILAAKGLTLEDLRSNDIKTPMMRWFELKFGSPIEVLLEGSLTECARRLGTNKSTISKWKKRLGIDQPMQAA